MRSRFWILASLLLGIVCLCLYARGRAPLLSNDAFQYLDATRNFVSGECLCTHMAHFDEQVAVGHLPVPFTHFPAGYPLLIAAVSRLGFSPETAGFLIAAASYLLTLWLIWQVALELGAKPWAIALLSLVWMANSRALTDASAVGTEAIFTAAIMAIALLMVRDLRKDGASPWLLPPIGLIAGAAYDIRYAALFLLPVAGLYLLWRVWRTPRSRWAALSGIAGMLALTAAQMARNVAYTGSWRGGNNSVTRQPVGTVLSETVKAFFHLVFGDAVAFRGDIWMAVFGIAVVAIALAFFLAWRRHAFAGMGGFMGYAYLWLGGMFAVYIAGVMLTIMVTIAADITRYVRPAYPLALALIAPLFSIALRRKWIAAAIAMTAAILAIQLRSLTSPIGPGPERVASNLLNQQVEPGVTAAAWLEQHVEPGHVMVAVDGQALHYLLHRDVVTALHPPFTARAVDSEGYHSLMTRFHARYLVLFPSLGEDQLPEQAGTPFLRDLAAGSPPPVWLTQDERTPAIAIYECASCGD
ncbi:MAG TPA: glycosyltransferase family 39 protein [Bryobacteraceae bacterium]|nr:glycosyltransferase family 39 protein [Bryobacteraceae bacterium]